jgi:V/A-type H+-transporting ATPase subunit D
VAKLKLTKMELRSQQIKLAQLSKYLPTLQLKKALLQSEVDHAQTQIDALAAEFTAHEARVASYSSLFSDRYATDLFSAVKITDVEKDHENIAGIDIPIFKKVLFTKSEYSLFDTPVWLEGAIIGVKELLEIREKLKVAEEKKRALEKELRDVSIRVNLFEKIMIPRTMQNIKRIKIFLGDQQLAAVSQAKVSKRKIYLRSLKKKHDSRS